MILAAIHRHPIKAFGHEAVARAALSPGEALPWDRRWAAPHARARIDGPGWASCTNFARGASSPSLMAVTAEVDEAAGHVTLRHPDRPDLTIDPDADGEAFAAWAAPLVAEGRPAPTGLRRAEGQALTDADRPWLSLHADASLRALSERAGRLLSRHRFRGNLWIEGAEPWAEAGWIGRTLRVGSAVLRVVEPIRRCRATEADPETGRRDADTLGAMTALLGDTTFGVYAEVVDGGEVARGDAVAVA